MSSDKRFYQMELSGRPMLYGDIGSAVKIQGLIIGGSGLTAALFLPGQEEKIQAWQELSSEEWSEFIRRSDDPEVLVEKIFLRKLRFEISGAVQQKVWAADNFECKYCFKKMGPIQLTVDHFYPLETGGKNEPSNYLSACRACNKKKGNLAPEVWCTQMNLDFNATEVYLAQRKL